MKKDPWLPRRGELFRQILRYEEEWPFFNVDNLSSQEVVYWAEELIGVYCITEHSIPYGMAGFYDDDLIIAYNPHLPEAEKVLTLGHELGHHILGHFNYSQMNFFSPGSLFLHSGFEKDASMVGFLALIPSRSLIKMLQGGRLFPEELYSDYRHLWSDLEENYAWEICKARVRIFNGLLRVCGGKCLKGVECRGC